MGSYADLVTPDLRTGHFVPGGLSTSGRLSPDDTVDFQRALIADATLVDLVAEPTRREFDRLCDIHVRGAVRYENFADVVNAAPTIYETALQQRFLAFYAGRDVPFVRADHAPAELPISSNTEYARVFGAVKPTKGMRLISSNGAVVWFNGMLDGLIQWARAEGLLRGQRARSFEQSVRTWRNDVSHGRKRVLAMPPASSDAIHDLAEFINQLWGMPTPGGRRYPAPVARHVEALGVNDTNAWGASAIHFGSLPTECPTDLTWILIRAANEYDGVHDYDFRFATSRTPIEYVYGPGDHAATAAWLADNAADPDVIDIVDQLVLIRHHHGVLDAPRYPEIAAALGKRDLTGDWYLMIADHPVSAWQCVQARIIDGTGHQNCQCQATLVAHGTWPKMLHRLAEHRPGLFVADSPFPRLLPATLPPDHFSPGFRTLPRSTVIRRTG